MRDTPQEPRLERALQYVDQAWIPLGQSTLKELTNRTRQGYYAQNKAELLKDLRRDNGTFLFVLKRLAEGASSKAANLEWHSPQELLVPERIQEIEKILSSPVISCGPHRLSGASPEQAERIVDSVVSACTAERLATQKGLDATLSFATALLRQLGLTLIAWNYPHVYKRVMGQVEPDSTLDQTFAGLLGFSPTLLGIRLARSWSLSPDVLIALGDEAALTNAESETSERAKQLVEICRVGECLARAAHPERYPTAERDWQEASSYIQRALGPQGLKSILKSAQDYLRDYAVDAPGVYQVPTRLSEAGETPPTAPTRCSNRYVELCPQPLRATLESLYSQMQTDVVSRQSVDKIINSIIPQAGFSRGCIFLLEPESLTLRARVAIGGINLNSLPALHFSVERSGESLITRAFASAIPEESQRSEINQAPCLCIAGLLGVTNKTGVLYLELGEQLETAQPSARLIIFKAVRQALNDSLMLR